MRVELTVFDGKTTLGAAYDGEFGDATEFFHHVTEYFKKVIEESDEG